MNLPLPSSSSPLSTDAAPVANRAMGELRARFRAVGGRTGVERAFEGGGLRLRFPNVAPGLVPGCEAVTINTGGGMVGGDTARLRFDVDDGASVTITSQSAEKIYRCTGAPTRVETVLTLAEGAHLEWLPQDTILFDDAHLHRRLDVDLAADARLLLVESVVFGRLAMGERVRTGSFRDRWRIRRGGALVFAEAVAIEGDIAALLARPALGAGATAMATLLLVAPDAEARLSDIRDIVAPFGAEAGASAWSGLLVVRLLSPSPERVRAAIIGLLAGLRGRAAPRVWQ